MNGIQEVRGSTPLISTKKKRTAKAVRFFGEICGRESLCKMPVNKEPSPRKRACERSASCPARPRQRRGRGVGSDSPPRIARVSPPKRNGLQRQSVFLVKYADENLCARCPLTKNPPLESEPASGGHLAQPGRRPGCGFRLPAAHRAGLHQKETDCKSGLLIRMFAN